MQEKIFAGGTPFAGGKRTQFGVTFHLTYPPSLLQTWTPALPAYAPTTLLDASSHAPAAIKLPDCAHRARARPCRAPAR